MPFGIVSLTNGVPMPDHVPPQGFSFRSKKGLATASSPIDLGVTPLYRLLVTLGPLAAPAIKHPGGPFQQGSPPLMDYRRMHPEPARQFRHGLLAFQRLKCHLRLELGRVLLAFSTSLTSFSSKTS
jgi:hypothetical protein